MGAEDRRPEALVRLKGADTAWSNLGAEHARGITHEGLNASANLAGPDTCSFTLRRDPTIPWPDLDAFSPIEVEIGGTPVWSGRLWDTPRRTGSERAISVTARGYQSHLDDDQDQLGYVHTRTGEWRDIRSASLNIDMLRFPQAWNVSNDRGAVVIGIPKGADLGPGTGSAAAVQLDLGANGPRAARVLVEYEAENSGASLTFYARTTDSDDPNDGTHNDYFNTLTTSLTTGGTKAFISGNATGKRYLTLGYYHSGGTGSAGSDFLVKMHRIWLFESTGYESGNASILKASDVVTDVLGSGLLPLLETGDTSQIETTAFSIPELWPSGYQTPRQVLNAVNAYEDNLLGVDHLRRLFFGEKPSIASVEVGEWSGSEFSDATTGSAEGLFNKVIVQATGPSGETIFEERTLASSLLTRHGFTRTAVLNVGAAITTTAAQQLGDIWLAEKAAPPLKGSVTVTGQGGARRAVGGAPVAPHELLLDYGQLLRLSNVVNPTTGAWGREGRIVSVSYAHDSGQATLQLDNDRGRFEALLARLGVVQGQIR